VNRPPPSHQPGRSRNPGVSAGFHLTGRDHQILGLLADQRVMTTHHLLDLAYSSHRKTLKRMHLLRQLGLVDAFRPPHHPGSAPYHWVLAEAGAHLVAARRGLTPAQLAWRRDRIAVLAHSDQLAHTTGIHSVFTALARQARTRSDCRLLTWWSQWECQARWPDLVHPDGYGHWQEADASIPFCLEYDRGTESLTRLRGKLPGYQHLTSQAGHPILILFLFSTARREGHARRALAEAGTTLPIATTSQPLLTARSPAEEIWLPLSSSGHRHRLAALAHLARASP
jgi:hypothetical protein